MQEQASGSAALQLGLHAASHVPSLQPGRGSAPTHSVPHPRPGLRGQCGHSGTDPWWAEAAGRCPSYSRKACHCWLRQGQLSWCGVGVGWGWDGLGKVMRDWHSWEEGVNCMRVRGESISKLGTEETQNFPWMISFSFQPREHLTKTSPISFPPCPCHLFLSIYLPQNKPIKMAPGNKYCKTPWSRFAR